MNSIFLGIGAQKAGTSWLHHSLAAHPEVWMPPVKELHFFDEREARARDALAPRIVTRAARVGLREFGARVLRSPERGMVRWGARFFFTSRDISWYRNILRAKRALAVGDITPAYSTLSDDSVARLAGELPGVRAILILRNPVERAFSHAVMDLRRGRRNRKREIAPKEFYSHFRSTASRKRTGYVATIDRWHRVVGKDRLLVEFFEEIARNPVQLLGRVTSFLGLSAIDWGALASLSRRVNAGQSKPIPAEYRSHLADMYRDEMRELALRYGGYADVWYKDSR